MFVRTRKLVISVAAAVTLAGLLAGAALAGPIEDRQKSMKEQGNDLGIIAAMLKGERDFDVTTVKQVSDDLVAHFEHDKTLFPEGSDKGDVETWAKPEIWTDHEAFLKRFDDAVVVAKELGTVTEKAALAPVLGKMGKDVCTGCHEQFRRPKN